MHSKWRRYLAAVRTTGHDLWALLEFVKDGTHESLQRDAATRVALVNERTENN